jgi:hypothetical protein
MQNPLYKLYNTEIDAAFLSVDNGLEDTYLYEFTELKQHSTTLNANLPNNTRSYETKKNTWKYLEAKSTDLLALYRVNMLKNYRFRAHTWGKPEPQYLCEPKETVHRTVT